MIDIKLKKNINKQLIVSKAIFIVAVLSSFFALFTGLFGERVDLIQRGVHLGFALTLVFLITGLNKIGFKWLIDFVASIAGAFSAIYLVSQYNQIMLREGLMTQFEILLGAIVIFILLEATRRMVGWALPLIGLCCVAYAYFGPYLPFGLNHRGYSFERIAGHLYLSTDGIYGIPLGVSATFVFMFILLGSFMKMSGAGEFFNDLALGLTGRTRGGPAKVAVVSSAFFGTISGSAIANASATGTFTIPLMRRVGYKPEVAAAFESLASLGGQLMPPIMGSAAFVMIEFTQIPYLEIAASALIPGLLFFFTVFVIVDLEAVKHGLKGLPKEQLPRLGATLWDGWTLFVPLIVLFVLLFLGFSTFKAAFWTVPTTLMVTLLRKSTRISFHEVLVALNNGGIGILGIALACACAGIVVGVATMTGLAVQISSLLISLSGGSLFILLLLTMLVSLLLGMGLPTVACYILLAVLLGPALESFGIPLLAAHLFIFYFGIVSGITPPVALVSYAAAGVAKSDVVSTAWVACRMGIVVYILPFIFVYNTSLLGFGPWWAVVFSCLKAVIGCALLAAVILGYLIGPLGIIFRVLFAVVASSLLFPSTIVSASGLMGFILLIIVYWQKMQHFIPRAGAVKDVKF